MIFLTAFDTDPVVNFRRITVICGVLGNGESPIAKQIKSVIFNSIEILDTSGLLPSGPLEKAEVDLYLLYSDVH